MDNVQIVLLCIGIAVVAAAAAGTPLSFAAVGPPKKGAPGEGGGGGGAAHPRAHLSLPPGASLASFWAPRKNPAARRRRTPARRPIKPSPTDPRY